MSNTQLMHTICMRTEDGENVNEGEYRMKLSGANPRLSAVKTALGSLEFPMVQYTIEKDWSRLYFSEGFKIVQETSFFRLQEESNPEGKITTQDTNVTLPLHLNEILELRQLNEWVIVRCQHPHHMWIQSRRCMIPFYTWEEPHLICTPMGRISLALMARQGELYYLSDTEFMFKNAFEKSIEAKSPRAGFLYFPIIPSLSILCETLTHVLSNSNTLASYQVNYETSTNITSIAATTYPEYSTYLKITLQGSHLATMLGYSSSTHEQKFHRPKSSNHIELMDQQNFAQPYDHTPLILRSEPNPSWDYICLTPGWYAPQHRPMITGSPLRMTTELETAFNKLYFSLPERIPSGMPTAYFLIFTDPTGTTHNCPLYAGRYSPISFCAHLEHEMTRLARNLTDCTFSVFYDDKKDNFTFSCERRLQDGSVVPNTFSLIFNHPAQFDPSRMGFPAQPLYGSDTYTSTDPVVFPHLEMPRKVWSDGFCCAHSNIYRVSEIQHQKRFRFHAATIPNLTCVIISFNANDCTLRLRTYVGQLPFSHGFQPNDIVNLSELPGANLFVHDPESQRWSEQQFEGCPMSADGGRIGIVLSDVTLSNPDDISLLPIELYLRVRYSPALSECIGKVLQIQPQVRPFSFCFSLPKSIKHSMLGFPKGAIEWGKFGNVLGNMHKRPPIDAPFIHNLDHPDYILMYLDEGKKGSLLQHTSQLNNTSPFAKLVLYPLFREERMLPRDTTLLSGESLSNFTIRFTNPDGTPYHFHGAQFSFSLNFVSTP
jgi:hypothetical protein